MKTHSATQSHAPATQPRSGAGARAPDRAGQAFQQSLTEAATSGKGKGKRTADEADLPAGGKEPNTSKLPGTHGYKTYEQQRLGTSGQTHQSEHPLGFSSAHPGMDRKTNHPTEQSMPAYQEVKDLHRGHAGTGTGTKPGETGFASAKEYRQHQNNAINDPTARHEGTALSNSYQLNQLGYAHQMAQNETQYTGKAPSEDIRKSNDSYANMINHNQPQTHVVNGSQVSDRLDPHGQAEALLAREAAHSGQWPTSGRIDEVLKQFGIATKSK